MQKITLFTLLLILLIGCSAEKGTLEFHANGEDFVRQGFTSVDGWSIQFEHVYVTLSDVTAYQTDPPFNPQSGAAPEGTSVGLADMMTIDLAEGDENADPIVVGSVEADTGQYNAISWNMRNDSVQMIGSAEKDGQTVDFDLTFNEAYSYACGEFIGDERKGFVDANSTGDVEMTFHFDHVFGDAETDLDEALNRGALGFDPLAAIATDGTLEMTQSELSEQLSAEDYDTLLDTLATLGHVGEGHCFEATGGYTDKEQ